MVTMFGTIVVGTDGSQSSFLAVRRAAAIAAAFDAELVLASAYYPQDADVANSSRDDSRVVVGEPDANEVLAAALKEAKDEGATNVTAKMKAGAPVVALMSVVTEVDADLLVVGNRGINSLTGRLLGSVPADVARQSQCDVMIVHTVD
ncbi:universal stress protein [Corynebacterium sp. zg254]|uniref:Universal stress protein n=1 Tax=Corynebacterium zhongnanshanii TaxID=2768834 RepID=A0ABQ6VD15_9CORY|nr:MULTISPECIES: universal stress protein [Corynebacterium]KAB1551212.1 universal stress protein [Corynebacterium sp. 321]KAB3520752.1 universal stress protein [Corynebacterium zhongnanshanii]MCR5914365.1 universal stress protein [Corynebacterium sp. zg254]